MADAWYRNISKPSWVNKDNGKRFGITAALVAAGWIGNSAWNRQPTTIGNLSELVEKHQQGNTILEANGLRSSIIKNTLQGDGKSIRTQALGIFRGDSEVVLPLHVRGLAGDDNAINVMIALDSLGSALPYLGQTSNTPLDDPNVYVLGRP